MREVADLIPRLETNVNSVLRGKKEIVRLAIVGMFAKGHVLIQDVPGVGKTTLAQALAKSIGLDFQRIQFTSDLLPSDIIGVSVFSRADENFEFVPGPIFANLVLADEINRATPKTQSALLEAMSEGTVSVDRERRRLQEPFIVLATQNPLEYIGTFPLPESQLDRFLMSLRLGYPPMNDERQLLLSGGVERVLADLQPTLTREQFLTVQRAVSEILVSDKIADYILAMAERTRRSREFALGISTRGVQGLLRAAQAMALCEGRSFVIPDDVRRLAPSVLAHRVVLNHGSADLDTSLKAIEQVIEATPVPI